MDIDIEAFFSEPGGWEEARISIGSSIAFFGIYACFELLYNSGSLSLLVFGSATALSGTAELLPKNRRRSAIVLRVTAIVLLVALIAVALRSLLW
ncbi:hypothetical protein A6E15_00335 [Natrinema saccharevitans]|uniref:Uncharacterized protein n=1 Tax=Natrinema saccharevitans TaxID=301967 RepID=A0A1S8ASP6_9EURY|nr:hypothetical protein [Natrinema saccharevitans]OLZ39524.1 hypothetical protein A6E15_00335 [Natrinema saccharevitans]